MTAREPAGIELWYRNAVDVTSNRKHKIMAAKPARNHHGKDPSWRRWISTEKSDTYEICQEVPKALGVGTRREIRLFSGIHLCVVNWRFHEDFKSELDPALPCLGFGFSLSGKTRIKQACLKHELLITGRQSAYYCFPDMKGSCEVRSGESTLRVGILMQPDFFRSFMEEERHYESTRLRRIIENRSGDGFRRENNVTPSMELALQQIANCPYQGPARRFFYEAKAMELIFQKLKQVESVKMETRAQPRLQPADAERICMAGELLTKQMESPPGLAELSRSVGLSRTRLLMDFPKVFGSSPYKYLRNMRLEKAGILFNEGKINVTEAAHMVGYSSLSHFTKAFKQYFGVTPSRFKRGQRP